VAALAAAVATGAIAGYALIGRFGQLRAIAMRR
jgi:hypothetical protein